MTNNDLYDFGLRIVRLIENDDLYVKALIKKDADIKQLRETLKPFAKSADNFDGMNIKNEEEWFAYSGVSTNEGLIGAITVGDLRRSRAALKEVE